MSVRLPELARIDYTSLDYDSIISLVSDLITNHPDYFSNVDDFLSSNAGRVTIEVVAFVMSILADRIDWIANENFEPTATQKTNLMNILKLINYRLTLPTTAACTVRATINSWVDPFAIPARYTVPATDLDGSRVYFELLNKDDNNKYIYEGTSSSYEFDTSYQVSPTLFHSDLVFYEGRSYREFFTMSGVDNEYIKLSKVGIEEGSIRVWKVSRDGDGNIISKKELTIVTSFISPEAQDASDIDLPPCKIQNTEENSAYLIFGESAVVATFNPNGLDEIMVWYRVTSGSVGNITLNSINYTTNISAAGNTLQISFINLTSGSGGSESETTEHARRYGPLSLTTVEKTVNPTDFVVLLQDNSTIMNSITYGKSNEPDEIYNDFGYHIPPFESWIYPVINKLGWESFETYSYPTSMRIGRPYQPYGPRDKEFITFQSGEQQIELTKLKDNAHHNDYSNLRVSDLMHSTLYSPGNDFVIDLESRTIVRLTGGNIAATDTVLVQYYEDSNQEEYVQINFATGDEQSIPQAPVYPGERTYAWSLDTRTTYEENTLSTNDYNYPNNDYIIDYLNGTITRNSVYPYIDSKFTLYEAADVGTFPYSNSTASVNVKGAINDELIVSFDGLNREVLNADHDFKFGAFNGWSAAGTGNSVDFGTADDFYFKIAVDSTDPVEYYFNTSGTKTVREIVTLIKTSCTPAFPTSTVELFADYWHYPSSPKLTFMSKTSGITSRIQLAAGTTGTNLFDVSFMSLDSGDQDNFGEDINIVELATRCRSVLNTLGLCNGYKGQEVVSGSAEYPEIYSRANIYDYTDFHMNSTIGRKVKFTLSGTQSHNVTKEVLFANVETYEPYDLRNIQDRMDLIKYMNLDLADASNGFNGSGVVEALWLRTEDGYYRIGFRLLDVDWTSTPTIKIEEAASDGTIGGLHILRFGDGQTNNDDNLVEIKVSPNSDMVNNHYLRFKLYGAFGATAKIQVKANNAIHNNTLDLMQLGDDQVSYGTGILANTIMSEKDLIGDGSYTFSLDTDDRFNLTITSIPEGDGDYIITIPAATYNIDSLVVAINTALTTADKSGAPTDISDRLICEKVEGENKIRFRLISYDTSASNPPDVEINDNDDAIINKKCIDILGFTIGRKMSDYSTIILHYNGDYISDADSDTSESTSIVNYLEDNRLIHQDYIIQDPTFTPFDVVGTVYLEKGFDPDTIKSQVIANLEAAFLISEREFSENLTASSIIDVVKETEGIDSLIISYLGKDYQLYKKYIDNDKQAIIEGTLPAEYVKARWESNSSFKITLDGCTVGGVNYDGEYLVTVGNGWTDRDYDSLLDYIQHGDGSTGGLQHATNLAMGKGIADLTNAIIVSHSSGIFKFTTINESQSVMIKLESPGQILTKGYQTFTRTSLILETEYTKSASYKITVEIDGDGGAEYTITSPASGDWPLYQIADLLEAQLPATALAGIDNEGKIRITSLLGGYSSTIDITAGGANNLLTLLTSADTAINGTAGYTDCLTDAVNGTLNIGSPITEHGTPDEPTLANQEDMYNYRVEIPAKYNEIIYLSNDYFYGTSTLVSSQLHGIIFTYVEVGQ